MGDQEDVLTPAPAHVNSGPPGRGGWRNPLAAVCGTLTLDNVSESASWRPQDTGTIRYDTRCYFNVRSKADMNRLNLPHGDDN